MSVVKNALGLFEFLRYIVVGSISFIIDTAVLYLFYEYIIANQIYSIYLATAFGFMAGMAVNYFLCHSFVFLSVKNHNLGKKFKDIITFVIIGIIGLLLNELGMFIGVELLGIYYLYVKLLTSSIVMLWNYLARKMLIFNIHFTHQQQ